MNVNVVVINDCCEHPNCCDLCTESKIEEFAIVF